MERRTVTTKRCVSDSTPMTKTACPRCVARVLPWLFSLLILVCTFCVPVQALALDDPQIQGTAALLVEPETGTVLYEKNADEQRYPASMTKIMTALVVLEHAQLTDQVTMTDADFAGLPVDSSMAGFVPGETLTVEQLLYGLLLPSGNEASYALARYVGGGSVDVFIQMMNDKAAELGCEHTHFVNPCGLHDPNHYTTARDMYRIMSAAMEDETFAKIVATPVYNMPATNLQQAREIENSNELLDTESSAYLASATGVKSGNTYEAGRCLAASAETDNMTLYSVVMGCADVPYGEMPPSMTESKRLLEWGFANYANTTVVGEGEEVKVELVTDSADNQTLSIVANNALVEPLPIDISDTDITVSYDLPDEYVAPIEQGTHLGTATYSYNGEVLGEVDLVAGNDVDISPIALVRNTMHDVFSNQNLMIGVAGGVVALVVLLVTLCVWRHIRRRNAGSHASSAPAKKESKSDGNSRHMRS